MLIQIFAIIALVVCHESDGRNVPGPDDPDTYDGRRITCETSPGMVFNESLSGRPDKVQIDKGCMKIYFHSNSQPEGVQLDLDDPSGSIKRTDFNPSKTTYFAVHGWKNDRTSLIFAVIKEALIPSKDVNLFIVDWSEVAIRNYVTARYCVSGVGKILGIFMQALVDCGYLDLNNTQIVGHSLGAHISGFAGATVGAKVRAIIGLDPAWPLFFFSKSDNRLNEKNAQFVQVIHTNGGLLAFPYSIGTSDYYPNGGSSQPGCSMDVSGSCAHSRSYAYYSESIKNGNFIAQKCDSFKIFKNGYCRFNRKSGMGQDLLDFRAQGDYYLTTNPQPPYGKGV